MALPVMEFQVQGYKIRKTFALFLVPKLRSVAQNELKKHPFFFNFSSKINEFERKKSKKKQKNSKNLEVGGN